MNKEKLKKISEEIRDEELIKIYQKVLVLFALCIIGALIGYIYCKNNQYILLFGLL